MKSLASIRNIRQYLLITTLLFVAFIASYIYIDTNGLFFKKPKSQLSGTIMLHKYNIAAEGSVLEHIYNFAAKVIPSKRIQRVFSKTIKSDFQNTTIANLDKNFNKDYQFTFKNDFSVNKIVKNINVNRFGGLVQGISLPENISKEKISGSQEWKYHSKDKKTIPNRILLKYKNDFSTKQKFFTTTSKDYIFNDNLIQVEKEPQINYDIVQKFSSDPLKSVIQDVLIPTGLPKTPANVDAIAKAMGLPSGALGSKNALASSLGLSVNELSNPDTKLSIATVNAINMSKNYLGKELDIKDTTLADYYSQAIKNNFFSGLNLKN